MGLVGQFVKHVVPGVLRPLRILWNQIIGFFFLVIAVTIGFQTYRRAQNLNGDAGGIALLVAAAIFTALLGWYGISSFLKARKISRSN